MANLKWLINKAGWEAEDLGSRLGSVASGYSIEDMMTGPRSNRVKSTASTSDVLFPQYLVNNPTGAATKFLEAQYAVVTRFDKILNHRYVTDYRLAFAAYNYSDGGYTSYLDYAPVSTGSYAKLGPYAQDAVFELSSSAEVRTVFEAGHSHSSGSDSWAAEIYNLSFCSAWDCGVSPILSPPPHWRKLEKGFEYIPLQGTRPFECEASIQLSWQGISDTQRDIWHDYYGEALLELWPMFLYDESKTLWAHKLEHVMLQGYAWARRGDGLNDLTCDFLRLKHYE